MKSQARLAAGTIRQGTGLEQVNRVARAAIRDGYEITMYPPTEHQYENATLIIEAVMSAASSLTQAT